MADKERAQSKATKDSIQQKINQTKGKLRDLSYKLAIAEAESRNAGASALPRSEFLPVSELGKLIFHYFF